MSKLFDSKWLQDFYAKKGGISFSDRVAIPDSKPRERKEALEASGERETQGAGLRHCRFTLYRKKLLDVDAKYSSVKDLLDCLTIALVIRGDKEGQITLEVEQVKVKRDEKTVIEVFNSLAEDSQEQAQPIEPPVPE